MELEKKEGKVLGEMTCIGSDLQISWIEERDAGQLYSVK